MRVATWPCYTARAHIGMLYSGGARARMIIMPLLLTEGPETMFRLPVFNHM